jgi:hypothetical protein
MNKKYFLLLAVFAFFMLFATCDNNSNNDNSNDSDNEEQENPKSDENSKFDELDKKMREIMDEPVDDEGPAKEIRVIQANGAKKVDVNLNIGAGKLKLSGGSTELMLAGFIYSDSLCKPEIKYDTKGEKGILSIVQPKGEGFNFKNNDRYVWNLKFNNEIPLDFDIELGAGVSEITLSELNIDDFSMNMGVGKSEIDLRGEWKKSTTIHLTGGIGLSKIYIPKNVGIRLNVDKGIGSIGYSGLIQKSRNQFVNKLYESADVILTIYLKTGIGRIEIE